MTSDPAAGNRGCVATPHLSVISHDDQLHVLGRRLGMTFVLRKTADREALAFGEGDTMYKNEGRH